MLTRRLILTSSLALLGGCAARAVSSPTTPPPTGGGAAPPASGGSAADVAPHANYNGTAGSGAPVPVQQATGTSSKPFAGFIYGQTLDRFSGDYLIGVFADASGGIKSVELTGDVASTTATAPSVQSVPHPSGTGTIGILAYWFKLTHAAFMAKSATGKVNVYAVVTPNDSTLLPRVIGGDGLGTGSASQANWTSAEKMPMQLFPRATAFDWDKGVGVGRDYATLDLALAAINGAAPKSPRITIYDNGPQIVSSRSSATYAGAEGYCEIRCAPGVSATIQKGLAFDPLNTGDAWDWWPGCEQIKFVGAGLTIDCKNFATLKSQTNTRPMWFYGCNIINSIGGRAQVAVYWNGGPHPGLGLGYAWTGASFPGYFDGANIDAVECGAYCHRFRHNTTNHVFTGKCNGTRVNAYNLIQDTGVDPMYPNWGPRITLTYSGPATTAYADIYGSSASPNPYIEVFENGASVFKLEWPNGYPGYRVYQRAAGAYAGQKVSEVVAMFNIKSAAYGGRWTATEVGNDTGPWASFLNNGSWRRRNLKGAAYTANGEAAGTGSATWNAGLDAHTEYQQMFTGQYSDNDNYLIYANKFVGVSFTTSFLNNNDLGTWIMKNCVLTKSVGSGNYSSFCGRHIVIENNYMDDGHRPGGSVVTGQWSSVRHNVFGGALMRRETAPNAGTWTAYPTYQNNMHVANSDGTPAGVNSFNNINLGSAAAWKALATNFTGGDFTPKTGGALYSNLVPRINDYDINNNPRGASDVFGPYRG